MSSSSPPITPAGVQGSSEAPPPLSVSVQPLDGASVEVHVLQLHSSSPGCLQLTMLPLSRWAVDCSFGDGVGILVQHVPNPGPSLPGDGGLHILLLALCWEVMAGNGSWPKDASDFPAACHVKGRQLGKVKLGHRPALWSIQNGQQYAALVELQLSLDSVLWWPPDYIHSIRWLPLVYCSHGFSSENAF